MAAVLLSCGEGSKDAGPAGSPAETDDYLAIYGYTYDARSGAPLGDVDVYWFCDSHDPPVFLGSDVADDYGRYDIVTQETWEGHNGHTLHGVASHPGYYADNRYIYNFRWQGIPYRRDFYLEPGK